MAVAELEELVVKETLSTEDVEKVFCASSPVRYDYFIKRVTRKGFVWALWEKEGWLTTTGRDGKERFLVWPDEVFARRTLDEQGKSLWPSAVVDKMPLSKWVASYLPDISGFGDKVWVFPAHQLNGGVVTAEDMIRDLKNEIERQARGALMRDSL